MYGKKSGEKSEHYCKLICFAKIPNFRGQVCEIKMLTNFSTKQVLPEFWQDWAWDHLWTLHVLSWDSSLTLWLQKKIPTNYCKLTLHAIFMKLLGSLHNILKIFLFLLFFLLNDCGPLEQIFLQKQTFLWLDLTRPRNGSNICTLF